MLMHKYGLAVLLACGVCLHAHADERALQAALTKTQLMLKQAAADKIVAEKQLAETRAELERSKQEFERYRKTTEGKLQAKEQGSTKLAGTVDALKERYVELQGKYAELNQRYVSSTRSGKEVDQKLKNHQENFQLCLENNRKLYDINQEILGNYQNKGMWEVMQESEPFTGFKAVKVENLIQDYQYKNDDLKLDEALLGSATAE